MVRGNVNRADTLSFAKAASVLIRQICPICSFFPDYVIQHFYLRPIDETQQGDPGLGLESFRESCDVTTLLTKKGWIWGLVLGLSLGFAAEGQASHKKCGHFTKVAACGGCGTAAPAACEVAPAFVCQEVTSYRTVTETIMERVPTTQMQTRSKLAYKTEQYPVMKTVAEQVPTTQMQTRYRTESKTEKYTVNKPVNETVQVPRTVTVMKPVTTTTMVTQAYTVTTPVTTTRQVTEWVDVPVASAQASPSGQSGTVTPTPQATTKKAVVKDVTETHNVTSTAFKQVPVQSTSYVPEQKTEMVATTVLKFVPETMSRQVPYTVSEQVPVTVMTTQYKQVTEMATRQVPYCVTEQVPVTVYTCVPRQVTKTIPVKHTVMVPVVTAPAAVAPSSQATPQS